MTQYIHIKSQDCTFINNLTSSISIHLQEPIFRKDDQIFEVSLVSCVIPYSWYVVNDRNNTISMIETDNIETFTTDFQLTNGNYNIREITSLLEIMLNDNTKNETSYSVQYSKSTNKITISTITEDRKTTFDFYYTYELLGFTYWNTYDLTIDTPVISPNVCNVYPDDNIYIRSNLMNHEAIDSFTRSATDILQKIEIRETHGSYIFLNNHVTPLRSDIMSISKIDLFITDEWNEVINLNGLNWSLTLKIEKSIRPSTYYQKMIENTIK